MLWSIRLARAHSSYCRRPSRLPESNSSKNLQSSSFSGATKTHTLPPWKAPWTVSLEITNFFRKYGFYFCHHILGWGYPEYAERIPDEVGLFVGVRRTLDAALLVAPIKIWMAYIYCFFFHFSIRTVVTAVMVAFGRFTLDLTTSTKLKPFKTGTALSKTHLNLFFRLNVLKRTAN